MRGLHALIVQSSLTHLVCSKLLQDYLYNYPSERLWRLIAMVALMLFGVFGLIFEISFYSSNDYYTLRSCNLLLWASSKGFH
jgi:hypothetical protein